jgi:hypothetical protein
MNLIKSLLVFILFVVLVIMTLPLLAAGLGVLIAIGGLLLVFGWAFIWFLPILLILMSDKTTGGEKLAWILAIIFLSWFAWIFYFLLAPIKPKRRFDYQR